MRILTLPQYLVGKRSAILDVAESPAAVVCGVLFTISAGFAREYDGQDLIHEPWHILRPLGASLVTGTILFILVHGAAVFRGRKSETPPPPPWHAYRSFMGLFWMTAPLAWLYAIPYEQFLSPVDAIRLNLWTLAVVAVWRVLLMTRVISVVYGVRVVPAFFMVMLFADAVVFTLVKLVPTPVISLMGGIRHTAQDALIAGVTFSVTMLSFLSAPIWILGALISLGFFVPTWPKIRPESGPPKPRALLIAALVSILVWAPALAISQPKQIRKREADQLLRNGQIEEALRLMSAHELSDYPPHWNPPPRLGYREAVPDLEAVRDAMRSQWPADWVADVYLRKTRRKVKEAMPPRRWEAEWPEIVAYNEKYGFNQQSVRDNADILAFLLEFDPTLTDTDRAALDRLIDVAQPENSENR